VWQIFPEPKREPVDHPAFVGLRPIAYCWPDAPVVVLLNERNTRCHQH
jgi:hypothetical protein